MGGEEHIILKELRQRLSSVVQLIDLRLFGSRAKGNAADSSDMDIFIEVESLNKTLQETIENIVWEISYEHLILIAPLIFTKDEIENSPLKESDIVRNIMKEGISV